MNKNIISKALITLFEAKGMKDYKLTIEIWIGLLERYDLKEQDIITGIDKLILTNTPYRMEFVDLYNIINSKTESNISEKLEDEWFNIIHRCQGRKVEIDPIAESSFLTITTYEKYGYSTNEYEKSSWHKRWIELYKYKLENIYKPVQINQEVKGLLEDINNKDTAIKELKCKD